MANQFFAEIILPLALPGTFTYHISQEQKKLLQTGQRVAVPFGSKKLYTGIVHSLHQNKPELYKTKGIDSILDEYPLVTSLQIRFWEWMADYYMCTLGEVYRNAFPSALKWESETFVKLRSIDFKNDSSLNPLEQMVLESLENKGVQKVSELSLLVDQRHLISVLKFLWEQGYVQLDEVLKEKYTPKKEYFLRVKPGLQSDEKRFNSALDNLKHAPKQREIILQLIVEEAQSPKPVKVSKFLKRIGASHATIRSMEEKNLLEIYELETSRIDEIDPEKQDPENLTLEQNQALKQIGIHFEADKPVLFHGVTGSGKTEVYIKLIEKHIQTEKTVLFLLPEISISSQMLQRIRKHFAEKVGIYHSGFNQSERVELWEKTLNGEYQIIIGPRSALFLPFQNLGLVIVDEEHENTYKQTDNKPFFHARDMALVLARFSGANVLLGSATPSIETYYNSKTGKYGLAELPNRFGESVLPSIELIDLRTALKNKEITGDISHQLRDEIQNVLKEGKQAIIFQNRRGFAPVVECLSCGHMPYCPNCDVSLTYHKFSNRLKCHYCGHSQAKPSKCVNCQSLELTTKGIGTEQIELQLASIFPKARIARMDVDAMRKKHAYEKLIEALEQQEIDILVGTQMLAKGLDFANVALVGVIRADSLLNFPDFRAHEKAFQLLTQVAGRAGRRKEQGKVFIQAYQPEHQILQNVTTYDYLKTVDEILYERKSFLYPPFVRLIQISFRHAKKERVEKAAVEFTKLMQIHLDAKHLLGPEEPPVGRVKNQFIRKVLIKIPADQSAQNTKALIRKNLDTLNTVAAFRSVRIDVDVDPY